MGNLWKYLFSSPEEEKKEEASEEKKEENQEEKKEETSEEKKEETQEEKKEETQEEKKEEAPEEKKEENQEEKKEEASEEKKEENQEAPQEPEPALFRLYHKLMANKFFTDFMLIIFIAVTGLFLILCYGEMQQTEGCVSFESCLEQWKTKNICNSFAKGNMKDVLSYLQVDQPVEDYTQDTQEALYKDLSKELSEEFKSLFKKKKIKLTKVKCEYVKIDKKKATRLVSTCRFQVSETKSFLLILERQKNNAYYMHLENEKGFKDPTFAKINALFHYVSTSYESASDYKLCSLLMKNDKESFQQASSYFYEDAEEYSSNEGYAKSIAGRLSALKSLNLTVTDAILAPYTYEKKQKKKKTHLILRITNENTKEILLFDQPLTVGLYGYQPDGPGILYGNETSHEIINSITWIFK